MSADAENVVAVVRVGSDALRIEGLSEERLRLALALLLAAERLRAEVADDRRDALVRAMIMADFDPVPEATIRQARRLAEHRERLLASGAYTTEALGRLRGDTSESATRTWLARRRQAGELFSVGHQHGTLVPAFQLDESGEPITTIRPVLRALGGAALDGWSTWTWFTATSTWLGGVPPIDLLAEEPDRVAEAAGRFASNAA
jgi:FAD/FMN-containing dehydrogenase